ncbi:polyadenylate-binding protein-interacting protein 2-like isoform X2 [Ptychodera flava]|uniref:polyadenylate-binding protein-interacting protein 2-like isoform X2 n=1 Tax=Ptychodera flava TaxID=63121 RepID=UPI003969D4D4
MKGPVEVAKSDSLLSNTPLIGATGDQFADYLWMAEVEEFDQKIMEELQEEEFMQACMEEMLLEEEADCYYPEHLDENFGTVAENIAKISLTDIQVLNEEDSPDS